MVSFNNKTGMLLAALLLPLLGGCQGTSGNVGVGWGDPKPPPREADERPMPPAHAPAHGRRAQAREGYRHYRYYPSVGVYFDSERGVYFYYSDDRWQVSVELPRRFRARLGDSVTVEAHAGEPYRDYRKHRAKYPPGQRKKNKHGNNGQGKGPPPGKGPFNGDNGED